jgi:hypothetical protein
VIPLTLSASSIQVADLCMKRWEAEYANRSRGLGNSAANLGSACHGALEDYVAKVYIEKLAVPSLDVLLGYYYTHTIALFGTPDHDMYEDGIEMLKGWFARTDLSEVTVLSVENKLNFDLPTSAGPITFNYIFDRLDQIDEDTYRVVDYKTIRMAYPPEDLHKKVQPRAYALAAAIQLKSQGISYNRIKIEFDLLRHERIGTFFTHEDNLQTWASLIRVAERIINTEEGKAPATLNPECVFCPVKAKCPQLLKSIDLGGALGLGTEELIDIRAQMEWQRKAVISGITELDNLLMTRAKEADTLEFTTAVNKMSVAVSATRTIDADMVESVIGTDMFTRYGGKSISMASYDKLIKDPNITDEQKVKLRALVGRKIGEPRIKIESNGFV